MADPCFILRNGHRTWLKWHRARKRVSDPVFTARRILEGLTLGASIEVDLVAHADRGYAVLHDLTLDHETSGTGPVRSATADDLRGLNLRDETGNLLPDTVLLLEDLAALIAEGTVHPDALVQLDYKEDAAALDAMAIANFASALAPVARHFILSSGDAQAVALLSAGLPALRIGYDPCHDDSIAQLRVEGDFSRFVCSALDAAPHAEMIYLAYPLIFAADDAGFDLIGVFHAAGKRVDAYTLQTSSAQDVARAERLLALKVDQITTDDPEELAAALSVPA